MSTPTDIARRAKQITKRQERETKRRYELLAGQVRSQLRKQLDEILKTNTKAFVMLLLEGGALKVNVEVAEKPPEPVIDEPAPTTEEERVALYRELAGSGLSDAEARGTAWPDVIDAPVIPDEDRTPPSSENPAFPLPVAYIPAEDRFEDEPGYVRPLLEIVPR